MEAAAPVVAVVVAGSGFRKARVGPGSGAAEESRSVRGPPAVAGSAFRKVMVVLVRVAGWN